jgi:hypothetical protein
LVSHNIENNQTRSDLVSRNFENCHFRLSGTNSESIQILPE